MSSWWHTPSGLIKESLRWWTLHWTRLNFLWISPTSIQEIRSFYGFTSQSHAACGKFIHVCSTSLSGSWWVSRCCLGAQIVLKQTLMEKHEERMNCSEFAKVISSKSFSMLAALGWNDKTELPMPVVLARRILDQLQRLDVFCLRLAFWHCFTSVCKLIDFATHVPLAFSQSGPTRLKQSPVLGSCGTQFGDPVPKVKASWGNVFISYFSCLVQCPVNSPAPVGAKGPVFLEAVTTASNRRRLTRSEKANCTHHKYFHWHSKLASLKTTLFDRQRANKSMKRVTLTTSHGLVFPPNCPRKSPNLQVILGIPNFEISPTNNSNQSKQPSGPARRG